MQADPYCRLWLRDGSKKSTSVRGRTVNPRWNEHFTLIVHSAAHQVLNLVLYDSGAVAGTLMFPWFDLQQRVVCICGSCG